MLFVLLQGMIGDSRRFLSDLGTFLQLSQLAVLFDHDGKFEFCFVYCCQVVLHCSLIEPVIGNLCKAVLP